MVMHVRDKEQKPYRLSLQPSITAPLVFVDAIARSGKAIFSDLIPSLTRMEHIQFCTELELTIQGLSLGAIDRDYADAFLRIYFNELSYNLQISRNVNFRKTDQTGIPNYQNPEIYYKRLERMDGDSVVDFCRSSKNYIPISTHELLVNYTQLESLELNFKMLSLWRNPVDVIYSWIKRGWGYRFTGNDPRSFMLNIKHGEGILPWHFALKTGALENITGSELCAKVVLILIDKAVENFKKVSTEKIHVVAFEEVCVDPDKALDGVCKWLDVQKTDYTSIAYQKARIPRIVSPQEFQDKINFLKQELSVELFAKLMKYSEWYQEGLYGIRSLK